MRRTVNIHLLYSYHNFKFVSVLLVWDGRHTVCSNVEVLMVWIASWVVHTRVTNWTLWNFLKAAEAPVGNAIVLQDS